MKKLHYILFGILMITGANVFAQESNQDKQSYYEQRAKEDAAYEQSLASKEIDDEETFWEDQKTYEKDLKKRDKKAYKAYMKGKRDAYKEHQSHCNNHCHHSDYYHHYTTVYYYDSRYNHNHPHYYRGVNARVSVGIPSAGVGLHL